MAIAVLVTLGVVGVAAMAIFLLAAGTAKAEVERLAPDYAKRLFNSGVGSLLSRTPVRFGVLFGEAVPSEVRGWVQPIRISGALLIGLTAFFLLALVATQL